VKEAPKHRKRKQHNRGFEPLAKSISGRVCEFLVWAAGKRPRSVLPYDEIAAAVLFEHQDTEEDLLSMEFSVRHAVSLARTKCRKQYHCDIITVRGVGLRASIDSADVLQHSVVRATETHRRTGVRLQEAADLVDNEEMPALIKATPAELRDELEVTHDWFTSHMAKYLRSFRRSGKALQPTIEVL